MRQRNWLHQRPKLLAKGHFEKDRFLPTSCCKQQVAEELNGSRAELAEFSAILPCLGRLCITCLHCPLLLCDARLGWRTWSMPCRLPAKQLLRHELQCVGCKTSVGLQTSTSRDSRRDLCAYCERIRHPTPSAFARCVKLLYRNGGLQALQALRPCLQACRLRTECRSLEAVVNTVMIFANTVSSSADSAEHLNCKFESGFRPCTRARKPIMRRAS